MISVLIPVFNRDVNKLVRALSKQLKLLNNPGELIVMDDGSETYYRNLNSNLAGVEFVHYVESKTNNGRIRIRQQLAEMAAYEWMLFLDCDSTIIDEQFLRNYCNIYKHSGHVIAGGRIYTLQQPADCRLMLHWKYGTTRETTKFDKDNRPNRFMTNNFLVSKTIFKKFDFAGGWAGYGYEDSWMAIQLEAMEAVVMFIDNPVMHDGVEASAAFLKKSEEALHHLKRLGELTAPAILAKHVRLYYCFYRLRSWKILWLVRLIYSLIRRYVHLNLASCKPSLMLFDLFRLNFFISVNDRKYDQNN